MKTIDNVQIEKNINGFKFKVIWTKKKSKFAKNLLESEPEWIHFYDNNFSRAITQVNSHFAHLQSNFSKL
jgi:hypothetical protein